MTGFPYRTTPYAHQAAALEQRAALAAWGHRWEMGTGKTKAIIDQAAAAFLEGRIDALWIIAPNGVHRNWAEEELPVHLAECVETFADVHVWDSRKERGKARTAARERLLKTDRLAILVTNYEAYSRPGLLREYTVKFIKARCVFACADESHLIKTPSAKRTKWLVMAAQKCEARRILTGTMIANSPFDAYSQLRFLGADIWKEHGISTYQGFKMRFGVWERRSGPHGWFDDLVEYRNMALLERVIAQHTDRVTKDDVLDLPPKVYTRRPFEMGDEQGRIYRELRDEMTVMIDETRVDADLALVLLLRLQQVACGYVSDEEGKIIGVVDGPNPRIEAAVAWAEQCEHQAIIWCRFKPDVRALAARLDAAVYYGEGDTLQEFKDGRRKFLVATPSKGATGITLVNAKHVLYYSNSFSLTDRLQSEDRCHRIGQENRVDYTDLEAMDTVDGRIIGALRAKKEIADQLNRDPIKKWI